MNELINAIKSVDCAVDYICEGIALCIVGKTAGKVSDELSDSSGGSIGKLADDSEVKPKARIGF